MRDCRSTLDGDPPDGGQTAASDTAPHQDRTRLVERWLELTRRVLPAMAAEEGWPIQADHCFMRVCLDTAVGRPWPQVVKPPAIRHLTDAQLAAAVAVAEDIAARPDRFAGLNAQSIADRRAAKNALAADPGGTARGDRL